MWLNRAINCLGGEIGIHAGLRSPCRKAWRFKSSPRHQLEIQLKFMRPKGGVKIEWSSKFAYALGLIATDGNLSSDGRHIVFTSKDEDLILIFKKSLGIEKLHVGRKSGGVSKEKKYFVVQIGDVAFYKFLDKIGIGPKKSKVIQKVDIPDDLFFHFLRGCIDGDGSIVEYNHPQSKIPQLKTRLYSASEVFLSWIKQETENAGVLSKIFTDKRGLSALVFYKTESEKLFDKIYKDAEGFFLERKYRLAFKYMNF